MRSIVRACVFVLGLASACGGSPPMPVQHAQSYPGFLASSETLGRPFVVQQSLHGTYGERDISVDVVVQLANGKLTLVGLTPFGSRAFVLEQAGGTTHFQKFVDREIPFDPSYVLNDVHRVFFRGLKGPLSDGMHSQEEHGERITERWQGGVLLERSFVRLDGDPKGSIVARFSGPPSPVIAPEVMLENQWFGYRLTIENESQSFL